jgi:hypothetical protein
LKPGDCESSAQTVQKVACWSVEVVGAGEGGSGETHCRTDEGRRRESARCFDSGSDSEAVSGGQASKAAGEKA